MSVPYNKAPFISHSYSHRPMRIRKRLFNMHDKIMHGIDYANDSEVFEFYYKE